ncbi:MAG: hypothetical protein QXR48_04290 [Candidatus Woesearchaeota archaeon]
MKKEGLHQLAYSLTLDPEEEILNALEEAKGQSRLEVIVEDDEKAGLEASIAEAPVLYCDNSASYSSDAVELPENYKDSGYRAKNDDYDNVEVRYELEDMEQVTAEAYDKQIDDQVFLNAIGLHYEQTYASADEMERVESYKISLGYAKRFLIYAMKALTF